jgi:hypothetical protein
MLLEQPDSVVFSKVKITAGKHYQEHIMVAAEQEAAKNRAITEMLLQKGYENIRLLPIIDRKEPQLRERYYGRDFKNTTLCPDAKINGINAEYKESNKTNLSINIGKAALKGNIVAIKLTEQVSEVHIADVVKQQWDMERRKNLNEIVVINKDDSILVFKRP